MIYGLAVVATERPREWACIELDLPWTSPPPVGAEWRCCGRISVDSAAVTGATWTGMDGVDIRIALSGPRRLVNHLISEHGFASRLTG